VDEAAFSNKTRPDYYNLEHPPLGKYIIAASIAFCGDKPLCWRLPGIIEASVLVAVLGLSTAARRSPAWYAAGAAAALAAAADPVLYRSAAVAMLDIHLAFFTGLSIAAASRGRLTLAAVLAGLAASVKYSGVAAVFAAMLVAVAYLGAKRGTVEAARILLVSLAVFALVHVPLAAYFGPGRLVEETLRALEWHTTPRPEGPPTSTPLEWVLNANPFYYSFAPGPVAAETNTIIHFYAIAGTLLAATALARGKCHQPPYTAGPLNYAMVFAVYALVMALGNTTLYSFYAVQLTPGAAATVASMTACAAGTRPHQARLIPWRRELPLSTVVEREARGPV